MKITKLEIGDFGRFHQYTLELSEGMNIIYGENEDGKTTLMSFLRLMFYSNQKSTRDLTNLRKKYLPWGKETMNGAIELEAEGKQYRVQKSFGSTAAKDDMDIYCISTGEKILLPKDMEAGEWFFHLDGDAFERSLFIGQPGPILSYDGKKKDDIAGRLENMESSGDESVSAEDVMKRIQDAKEAMVSKRQSNGILVKSKAKEAELLQKIAKIKELESLQRQQYEEIRDLSKDRDECKKNKLRLSLEMEKEKQSVDQIMEAQNTLEECKRRTELQKAQVDSEIKLQQMRMATEEDKLSFLLKNEPKAIQHNFVVRYGIPALFTAAVSAAGAFLVHPVFLFGMIVTVLMILLFFSGKKAEKAGKRNWEEWMESKEACRLRIQEQKEAGNGIEKQILLLKSFEEIQKEAEDDLIQRQKEYSAFAGLRDEYNACMEEISDIEQQIFALQASLKRPETGIEELAGELSILREKIEEQQLYYDALSFAGDIMQEAADELRHSFSPKLNKMTADIFTKLTNGKYQYLLVSKAYDISVLPEGVQYREGDYFSKGTTDQMYFALRLAMLLLLEEKEGLQLPVFLDDSFASYDTKRCRETLRYIKEYLTNDRKQIILFTCHESMADLSEEIDFKITKKNLHIDKQKVFGKMC